MKVVTKEATKGVALRPAVIVITNRCAGCQECIIRCPTKALSMDMIKWVAKVDNELCVGCRQCQRTCPFAAIVVEGPVLIAPQTKPVPSAITVSVGSIAEVRPGFSNIEEAVAEATRCLNCPDPTCMRGCPAHNDIPGFIEAVRNRDLMKARKVLAATTCMPEVCSRVCDWASQCEGSCNWTLAGRESVAIGKLERFVADNTTTPTGPNVSKRGEGLSVGIIGSGPAGVAAALELASAGGAVTIYERDSDLGGVMRWGIPSYILPDKVTDRSLKALRGSGVDIRTGSRIAPEDMPRLLEKHDAVITAFGASIAERPDIPGLDLSGVVDATEFLTQAKQSLAIGMTAQELVGARIIVLGGSNTALDVARSAIRIGAKPVVIHRREERFSRARPDEIAEAKKEGVEFRFATNVSRLVGEAGKLKKVELVRTHQNKEEMDPAVVRGSEEMIEADMIVFATGYRTDRTFSPLLGKLPLRQLASSILPDRRWMASGITVQTNPNGRLVWEREYVLRASVTPRANRVWAIGDALVGPSSVVASMAQGRLVARAILEKQPRRPTIK